MSDFGNGAAMVERPADRFEVHLLHVANVPDGRGVAERRIEDTPFAVRLCPDQRIVSIQAEIGIGRHVREVDLELYTPEFARVAVDELVALFERRKAPARAEEVPS